ncbi:hypothetical protein DL770_000609 [Monosporascus sp. CRB-9-2]|nr:hypothetical protein DL770_000609 [Monosporascus sp. CRB-9-2]
MPSNQDFTYKSHGTNSSGNHYCARDYGSGAANSNSYHYSNRRIPVPTVPYLANDGSYYYSNPNGSTYHNNGQGGSTYTAPSGQKHQSGYGGK